jgi:hypothetical protein
VSARTVDVEGATYSLEPQPVRTSLSEGPPMLWGFEVNVFRDGEVVGVKTCFVGRVSIHSRAPEYVDGPMEKLVPILHDLALTKVEARLLEGEMGNEIVFA